MASNTRRVRLLSRGSDSLGAKYSEGLIVRVLNSLIVRGFISLRARDIAVLASWVISAPEHGSLHFGPWSIRSQVISVHGHSSTATFNSLVILAPCHFVRGSFKPLNSQSLVICAMGHFSQGSSIAVLSHFGHV